MRQSWCGGVRRDGETGVNVRALAKQLRRRIRAGGQVFRPDDFDVVPRQLGALEHVVQHAHVRPALLERDGFAFEIGEGLEIGTRDHVVAGGPGHLENHDALRARIGADDFRREADHVKRAAQERRLAGTIVAHLLHEIVARVELQIEALLLEQRAGLGRQPAIRVEGRHVAAPGDVRHLQRRRLRDRADGAGANDIGKALFLRAGGSGQREQGNRGKE